MKITSLDDAMEASKRARDFAKEHNMADENDRRILVLSLAV